LGGCSPVDKVAIKVHILKEQKILKKKTTKKLLTAHSTSYTACDW
jgi:hypothetical protein